MTTRLRLRPLHSHAISAIIGCFTSAATAAADDPFKALPENAGEEAKKFAVVFDFDKNSCYPAPAISADGTLNGGLDNTGDLDGDCRDKDQLTNSNTYYRTKTVEKDGVKYTVHMYALYFQKDQAVPVLDPGGHRHDWEYVLVWAKNGEVTHGSCSTHGGLETKLKEKLQSDGAHLKAVYHKDGALTHCFTFPNDKYAPKNDLKKWLTPPLVEWDKLDEKLRKKLNKAEFGDANCPVTDGNFEKEIKKDPPEGYPFK